MTGSQQSFRRKLIGFGALLGFVIFAVMGLSIIKAVAQTPGTPVAQEVSEHGEAAKHDDPGVIKFAFLAASIAVGVGSLGAGAAVGYVGAAAMGAIGEKPELAGRALIFVGLAEGIAIYGLIIAIMILGKV